MPKKESSSMDIGKSFKELEAIAAWFEKGETDLDQGLEKFERAMQLAETLRKHLGTAENRIREIKKKYSAE